MIDGEEFPDARWAVMDLINAGPVGGREVLAFYHLPTDPETGQLDPATFPCAIVFSDGGSVGYLDQVENVTVEVYGRGTEPTDTAKAIRRAVCGENIETPHGFFDSIKAERVPSDVPYHGETMKATLLLAATSRPL